MILKFDSTNNFCLGEVLVCSRLGPHYFKTLFQGYGKRLFYGKVMVKGSWFHYASETQIA